MTKQQGKNDGPRPTAASAKPATKAEPAKPAPAAKPATKAEPAKPAPAAKPVAKAEPAKPEPAAKPVAKPEPAAKPVAKPEPAAKPVAKAEPAKPVDAPAPKPIDLAVLFDNGRLPKGDAAAPSPPIGKAPPGDVRSLRRKNPGGVAAFAVVGRKGVALIVGVGNVGERGKWTSVSYPNKASASRAYARKCSALLADGYRDVTR